MRRSFLVLVLAAVCCVFVSGRLSACSYCVAPNQTLSEQLAQSQVAILVQWTGATPDNRDRGILGNTHYEVVDVLTDADHEFKQGTPVSLERFRPSQKGNLFLLLGTRDDSVEWGPPLEVTEASYQYLRNAPGPESDSLTRLTYFARYLEHPDPLLDSDACAEFAKASNKDVAAVARQFDPAKVRSWIASKHTNPTRLAFYGLLLGLCGGPDDAEFLRQKIAEPMPQGQDVPIGIDGIMAGYLLLAGPDGVDFLEKEKLTNPDTPVGEIFAAMSALRFIWVDGSNRVEKDRLRAAMRTLIDRPDVADWAIIDLSRWEDWSIQDRLVELWDKKGFDNPEVRKAIVRYTLAAARIPKDAASVPPRVTRAKEIIFLLQQKTPKIFEEAQRSSPAD